MFTSVHDLLVRVEKGAKHNGTTKTACFRLTELERSDIPHIAEAMKRGYIATVRRDVDTVAMIDISLTPEGLIETLFAPRPTGAVIRAAKHLDRSIA